MTAGGRRAWLVAGVWAAFQLLLTSLPGSALPGGLPGLDKLVHLVLYGVLGALVARAAMHEAWGRSAWIATGMVLMVLGGADEWHQQLVPGRSMELLDWIMDAAGAATGLVAGRQLGRRWAKVWLR